MDNHLPPPQPHTNTTLDGCATSNSKEFENLKSLVMQIAVASSPSNQLSLNEEAFLEKRIQDLALTAQRPDHPSYAWMIENAIQGLNEEGGSNEEAISKFILEEHKALPWAHDAYLKHHLKTLSENGTLFESHDGCYLVHKARITNGLRSKHGRRVICTTSRSRSSSPDLSRPNPSSSWSPTYASSDTDTSSSSQSFDPLKEGKKRNNKRTKSRRRKLNARGIRIHPKYVRGQGRAHGRGRGRGRGRRSGNPCKEDMLEEAYIGQEADDTCMHRMQMVDKQCLITEGEAADGQVADDKCKQGMQMVEIHCLTSEDDESIQGKELPREQADQDYVDESQEQQSLGMIDELLQKNKGDSCSRSKLITSEQGSKKVRQQKRNIRSRRKPRQIFMDEHTANVESQYVDRVEDEEGDSMDELIEQVCMDLQNDKAVPGEPQPQPQPQPPL